MTVRNTEVMHRSGFISFDCVHLQSLQYCLPLFSHHIELREDVLRDIVSSRWFSEEKKRACLLKEIAANAEGIPFSVEVEVGSSSSRRHVSVYDANLSYYKFGRVMVMFDIVNNTWNCHCVKAKQSCVHKAIAKWHFFQTRKDLFTRDESKGTQESQDSEDQVETVTSRDFQYPHRDEDLVGRIGRYIHNKKRLPADLPAKVYGLRSETEVPKHLTRVCLY